MPSTLAVDVLGIFVLIGVLVFTLEILSRLSAKVDSSIIPVAGSIKVVSSRFAVS